MNPYSAAHDATTAEKDADKGHDIERVLAVAGRRPTTVYSTGLVNAGTPKVTT
jgi:hypothetical protein